ncbi:unnamed protein product [Linum trigynum]|uniref:Uncharacterized protein n=1 Tax=Linum trigynum TaxID=586398 RepID=A0AAV2EBC8_9ROSI
MGIASSASSASTSRVINQSINCPLVSFQSLSCCRLSGFYPGDAVVAGALEGVGRLLQISPVCSVGFDSEGLTASEKMLGFD